MACKDGFRQEEEEREGDGDGAHFYSDPSLLFLFGDLVSPGESSLSAVLKPPARH